MKKALALVMAIAMVASMAVAASALELKPVVKDDPSALALGLVTEPLTYKDKALTTAASPVKYGTTLYLSLLDAGGTGLTEEKSVSNLKVTAEWEENGSYVEGVEIVKKKVNKLNGSAVAEDFYYFIAIETTGEKLDNVEVVGTIYLKGKSGSNKQATNYKVDHYVDLSFTLGYATADVEADGDIDVDSDTLTVYNFQQKTGTGANDPKIIADAVAEEYVLDFENKFVVTANVKSEKKVVLAADTDVIDEVEEAYPDANIDFYALTGAFKKTATVVVELEEGEEFLYAVVDGQVVEVNGEYDDWAEEFTFKTKKLGTYIISDVELELAEEVVVANPSTGAAA